MSVEAAKLLIRVKTRLGKSVPLYAKRIVQGQDSSESHMLRAHRELEGLLMNMNKSKRTTQFELDSELKQWFAKRGEHA